MGRPPISAEHTHLAADGGPAATALRQHYQHFLQLGSRRLPLTQYVHEPSYRSTTINTDALGLRYSHSMGKRFSVAERGGLARINLLVGGSTAQGIGASSDANTVASFLSALTGEVWLSLAGCGLNATQELMLFLTHQHRFSTVGHVVVLSGLNTLSQEALAEVLCQAQPHAEVRACEHFLSTFHENLYTQLPPTRPSLWQRFSRVLAPGRIAPQPDFELAANAEQRLMRAADSIGRTLRQWDLLLAGSDTTLTFMLQPFLPWCRDVIPTVEQSMLTVLDRQPTNFDRLLAGIDADEHHAAFFRRIKRQADNVTCYDMNGMLSSSPVFREPLFIDRLHFNDLGNNALAKVITAKLGLAQEKYTQRKVIPIKLV